VGKVIFDMSMSLDGFVRATGATPHDPLGRGGERLHEWAMGDDPPGAELVAAAVSEAGAFVCGRRTYDDSVAWWKADGLRFFEHIGDDHIQLEKVSVVDTTRAAHLRYRIAK
jgi:hypothetical protein